MATGGGDAYVDSRVVCSVCLEPYRGRQPKLLPCFHTFCLPCLTQLAGGDTQQVIANGRRADGAAASTITCPTCRTVSPVPPGGVAQFQTNFYVQKDGQQDSAPPVLCDLCDEGQVSISYCNKCKNRSCGKCSRIHNKICQSGTAETENAAGDSCGNSELLKKARNQLRVMETALTRLGEEEGEMGRERKATEDSINMRYAAGLGTMADARDECLVSLRETVQATRDNLQRKITAVRAAQERLSRLLRPGGLSTQNASSSQFQAALLGDEEFERLEKRVGKKGGAGFFEHTTMEDSPESTLNFHRGYMGKVVPKGQNTEPAGSTASHNAEDGIADTKTTLETVTDADHHQTTSAKEFADFQNEVKIKLGELYREINTLRDKHTKHKEQTSTLQAEKASLLRYLTSVRNRNAELSAELATFKREHSAWKDKCSLLCQDVAALQADNSEHREEPGAFLSSRTARRSALVAKRSSITADASDVQKSLGGLRKTVQADASKMITELSAVQKDVCSLQERVSRVETCSKTIARLETDMATVKTMVCFHATPTETTVTSYDAILVMDNVTVNVGNGYSPQTGIFTAPVSGIYVFMATSTPATDREASSSLKILVEDESVAESYNADYDSSATCHANVRLSAGQTVCVVSDNIFGSCSYHGSNRTCFSGVLVLPEI